MLADPGFRFYLYTAPAAARWSESSIRGIELAWLFSFGRSAESGASRSETTLTGTVLENRFLKRSGFLRTVP